MIIVHLSEGLGNQMFQYATARCLAEKHSTPVKLDISSFETNKRRKYGLHCFQIQEHLATQDEVATLLKQPKNRIDKLFKKAVNKVNKPTTNLVQEKFFHFNPDVLEAPLDTYLFGFWQSEKYFIEIKDILEIEFSFKYNQNHQNQELSEKIKSHESVAVHIRRGDYVQNEETYQLHRACSLDYYNRCITYISERVNNPHFFIFSDDTQWVQKNFKLNFPTYVVEHNTGILSYEDLRLISQCQHNIIANSSFSWWGAWLNSNPNKLVCAPQQWFNNRIKDTKYFIPEGYIPWYQDKFVDIKDLVPDNWTKL